MNCSYMTLTATCGKMIPQQMARRAHASANRLTPEKFCSEISTFLIYVLGFPRAHADGTWEQGFFVHLPLDSPHITMVKMERIINKSLSPSTITYIDVATHAYMPHTHAQNGFTFVIPLFTRRND